MLRLRVRRQRLPPNFLPPRSLWYENINKGLLSENDSFQIRFILRDLEGLSPAQGRGRGRLRRRQLHVRWPPQRPLPQGRRSKERREEEEEPSTSGGVRHRRPLSLKERRESGVEGIQKVKSTRRFLFLLDYSINASLIFYYSLAAVLSAAASIRR